MSDTDPITAIVDQFAAHAGAAHPARHPPRRPSRRGQRPAGRAHPQTAALGHVVEEHAAALTRLTATNQTARTATVTAPSQHRRGGSWRPTTGEPIARLRGWVEQVYRPGYGHLAAGLGPCWPAHDLCLYALDIASELWSVLYLQPDRSPALLSAQAEYQARILPALADQLRIETNTCGHPRNPAPAPGQPWTTP